MRTCVLVGIGWIWARTGDLAMEMSDIICSPEDKGGARVDNHIGIDDFKDVSVDRDGIHRDLPITLYRVRVKRRQGTRDS